VLPAEGARGRRAPPGAAGGAGALERPARRMARGLSSLASGERRPAGAL